MDVCFAVVEHSNTRTIKSYPREKEKSKDNFFSDSVEVYSVDYRNRKTMCMRGSICVQSGLGLERFQPSKPDFCFKIFLFSLIQC